MAGANLPAKKYKKTNPTQLRLEFEGQGNITQFIDIGMALSAINRKFARQGVYYYVNSVECYNNSDAVVDLHVAPDTWVTRNAWKRGFGIFQKMNALVDTPRPKYHDFKIYLTNLHRQSGSMNPILLGINSDVQEIVPDEWEYSKFVSGDDDGDGTQEADDFNVHLIGPHVNSVGGATDNGDWHSIGLIKSYSETRPEPDQSGEPILPAGHAIDPLMNIFDMSSEEMLNDIAINLDTINDRTPYNADLYNGEEVNHMQHVARLATSVSSGRVAKASGFCVPFGLICVDPDELQSAEDKYRIVLNLAAGTYPGTYAERV